MLQFIATPRVTTTLVPLNICPTEYCHTTKPTPRPLVNIIENRQEQNIFESKSKGIVTTHLIGDWIIRESSEPFQRKENERSTPIEQLVKEGKEFISNESIAPCQSLSPNVNQWTVSYCFIRLSIKLIRKKNSFKTNSRLSEAQDVDFFYSLYEKE